MLEKFAICTVCFLLKFTVLCNFANNVFGKIMRRIIFVRNSQISGAFSFYMWYISITLTHESKEVLSLKKIPDRIIIRKNSAERNDISLKIKDFQTSEFCFSDFVRNFLTKNTKLSMKGRLF